MSAKRRKLRNTPVLNLSELPNVEESKSSVLQLPNITTPARVLDVIEDIEIDDTDGADLNIYDIMDKLIYFDDYQDLDQCLIGAAQAITDEIFEPSHEEISHMARVKINIKIKCYLQYVIDCINKYRTYYGFSLQILIPNITEFMPGIARNFYEAQGIKVQTTPYRTSMEEFRNMPEHLNLKCVYCNNLIGTERSIEHILSVFDALLLIGINQRKGISHPANPKNYSRIKKASIRLIYVYTHNACNSKKSDKRVMKYLPGSPEDQAPYKTDYRSVAHIFGKIYPLDQDHMDLLDKVYNPLCAIYNGVFNRVRDDFPTRRPIGREMSDEYPITEKPIWFTNAILFQLFCCFKLFKNIPISKYKKIIQADSCLDNDQESDETLLHTLSEKVTNYNTKLKTNQPGLVDIAIFDEDYERLLGEKVDDDEEVDSTASNPKKRSLASSSSASSSSASTTPRKPVSTKKTPVSSSSASSSSASSSSASSSSASSSSASKSKTPKKTKGGNSYEKISIIKDYENIVDLINLFRLEAMDPNGLEKKLLEKMSKLKINLMKSYHVFLKKNNYSLDKFDNVCKLLAHIYITIYQSDFKPSKHKLKMHTTLKQNSTSKKHTTLKQNSTSKKHTTLKQNSTSKKRMTIKKFSNPKRINHMAIVA